MIQVDDETRELLRELEEELWRAETRFDRARMEQLFAEDFFEVGRSGRVYSREELLAVTGSEIDAVLPLPNMAIRYLAPGVAQITYNSLVTCNGKVERGRRSSIWSLDADTWRLRFHQGTVYEEDV